MLNGQLLIDFHVHLPQYAERTNSALEWFRSLCPSPEVYDAVSQTCADPANFTAMLERKGVDYAVLLAEMKQLNDCTYRLIRHLDAEKANANRKTTE